MIWWFALVLCALAFLGGIVATWALFAGAKLLDARAAQQEEDEFRRAHKWTWPPDGAQ
jgi:hypothetical protein